MPDGEFTVKGEPESVDSIEMVMGEKPIRPWRQHHDYKGHQLEVKLVRNFYMAEVFRTDEEGDCYRVFQTGSYMGSKGALKEAKEYVDAIKDHFAREGHPW